MLKKLGLALATLVVSALLAEGLLSLLADSSLRDVLHPPRVAAPPPYVPPVRMPTPAVPGVNAPSADGATTPGETSEIANGDVPGMYRIDDDPRVSYSLIPNAELTIFESTAHTDANGLRVLTGPAAQPGSPRVIVLGDSIAFGLGVNDDETLAARLQDTLAAVRGPDEPPVECRTVATPSWNHRSAPAFLLDHWDVVHADIVVYIPCKNDLFDLDGIYENGQRRVTADPGAADPWLSTSVTVMMDVIGQKIIEHNPKDIHSYELGAYALDADLSPESARRYDENAASIVRLRDDLALRGARLLLCWTNDADYNWHLSRRIDRLAPDIASVGLVDHVPPGGTLGYDPHPSASAQVVFATWLAQDLLDRGWIGRGANLPLPEVPSEWEEHHRPWPAPEEREHRSVRARAWQLKMLQSEIDFRTGRGVKQVYAGLNCDTLARGKMLVLLGPGGDTLQIELDPVKGRPDLYPLHVAVAVDGQPAGEVLVPPDGPGQAVLDLPGGAPDRPFEVSLTAEAAVLVHFGTRAEMAAFLPVRIACCPR